MRYTVYGNERIDREYACEGEEMTAAEAVAAFVDHYGFIPDGVLCEDEGEGEPYSDCMGLCVNCGMGLFDGEYIGDPEGVKWHRKGLPCPSSPSDLSDTELASERGCDGDA